MTMRTAPPFRADHVGSSLRPAELLAAREDHAEGRLGDDELKALEYRAIEDVMSPRRCSPSSPSTASS